MLRRLARALLRGAFLAVIAFFGTTASAQFFPSPTTLIAEDFSDPTQISSRWVTMVGSWSVAGGTFNNSSGATSMVAIHQYASHLPEEPPTSVLLYDVFDYRVRMRNPGTNPSQLVGLVYHLQDAANYFEIVFAPHGLVMLRRVSNGVPGVVATSSYASGGTGAWFDVELDRDENRSLTSVMVNGVPVFTDVVQDDYRDGRLALVTYNVAGSFDKVALRMFYGNVEPYRETFDEPYAAAWWNPPWTVEGGAYVNKAVNVTSVSLLPPTVGPLPDEVQSFIFRSRIMNPYGASGNLAGIVFHHEAERDYAEVVFSPTGEARLNRVLGYTRQTLATASVTAPPKTWFDVRFEMHSPSVISVEVNGESIFDQVPTGDKSSGRFGLITHWAPARFDDVWFDVGAFTPVSESFATSPPPSWVRSGQWDVQGGTLNSTAVGNTDVVATQCACWRTDYRYTARLMNRYGASGNLVGLVYNYQSAGLYAGDHYEVVFSPTGIARLNKVIQGTRYIVATAAHSVPRNVWFDVELIRSGPNTTVLVNGTPLFTDEIQAELGAGDIGVVTHWSRGSFDDLDVQEFVLR